MSMKLNLKLLATRFSQTKDGPPVSEDGVNRYLLEQVLRPNLKGGLLRLGDIDFDAFDADDVPALEDYYIRYPELYADITYYDTEYRDFPLPRLVFGFQYMPQEGKVARCRVCVVKDERLTSDTPTYRYPFSNVHGDNNICTGNNALPIYRDPARLHTLAGYLLRLPNNNDLYSRDNNRLHAEYRDLLEQMNSGWWSSAPATMRRLRMTLPWTLRFWSWNGSWPPGRRSSTSPPTPRPSLTPPQNWGS